jgi:hypothetical protein
MSSLDKKSILKKETLPSDVTLVRVTKVFNDPEDKDNADIFKNQFPSNSGIGAIEFELVNNITNLSRGYAKPLFTNQKLYPLINEIVYVISGPTFTTSEDSNNRQLYYLSSFNAWNSPHINPIPITNDNGDIINSTELNNDFGKTFKINANIQSLIAFEGDHILEGRWGNSIRFGSTVPSSSTPNQWSINGENGDPITIIRNGQTSNESNEGILVDFTLENVNTDPSSIYMTNNQQIPINVAKKTLDTFNIIIENSPNVGIEFEAESDITNFSSLTSFPLSQI